jgi:hypothetical protein
MIVELHNCYLLKSINRRTYFIVKAPDIYFSIYRNDAQLWRITYFLDTIQLFITPLICSQEQLLWPVNMMRTNFIPVCYLVKD